MNTFISGVGTNLQTISIGKETPAPAPSPIVKKASAPGWGFTKESALFEMAAMDIRIKAAAEAEALNVSRKDVADQAKAIARGAANAYKSGTNKTSLEAVYSEAAQSHNQDAITQFVDQEAERALTASSAALSAMVESYDSIDRSWLDTVFIDEFSSQLRNLGQKAWINDKGAPPEAGQPQPEQAEPISEVPGKIPSVPEVETTYNSELK